MKIVVLGDVGVVDGKMHIGDEAMFEVLLDELRRRGSATFVALSAAPGETAARYGVTAIPRIGFPPDRAAAQLRYAAVLACLDGGHALPQDDPVWGVLDAVAESDAVAIAGGGNLASTWPSHVFERAALSAIAVAHSRPVVVTGQTLGPHLTAPDRELVAGVLRSARLVGAREPASFRLAADLGTSPERLALTVDDASFLGFDDPAPAADPFVLVSLSTHLGGRPRAAVVAALAARLDEVNRTTGMPTRFHAHYGSLSAGLSRGDAALHEEVRGAMDTVTEVVPTGSPRTAAALARSAGLLVTGRYHPAVFAAPAGVPIAGLVADAYTDVKLRGALGHWGQGDPLSLDDMLAGPTGALLAVAARGEQTRVNAAAALPAARAAASVWWDRLAAALLS